MKIFIDNGHGSDTPGKRSPDGKFLEYRYNRIIAARVVSNLVDCGYDAELLVPEETDIPLPKRARRVNAHCAALGPSNVLLVSIHVTRHVGWTGTSLTGCQTVPISQGQRT